MSTRRDAVVRLAVALGLLAAGVCGLVWLPDTELYRAMPPLLAAIATAVVSSGVITIGGAVLTMQTAIFAGLTVGNLIFVSTLVYGVVQQRKAEKRARAAYNANVTDRYAPVMSASEAPWQIIYGEAPVGACQVAAQLTSGDRDQFKYVVFIWAAHECEAITDVMINGLSVGPLDAGGYVQPGSKWFKASNSPITDTRTPNGSGQVTVSRPVGAVQSVSGTFGSGDGQESVTVPSAAVSFSGSTITVNPAYLTGNLAGAALQFTYTAGNDGQSMIRVEHHLGTSTQAASPMLLAECPGDWSSSDQLKGLCYSVVRFNLDETEFQGGPPQVTVRIKGRKLYDPRTATTAWSANAALAAADFVRAEYGKKATEGQVDWAKVSAQANVCDEVLASQGGAKRYTVNGAFRTDADPDTTLAQLAQAMAGFVTFDGTWQMQAGAYTAPVMDITDADNNGPVEVVGDVAGDDVFNSVKGRFFDPARFDQLTDYTPFQIAGYVTADGDPIWSDLDLPFTTAHWRAHNIARIQVERSRGMQLVWPGKLRLLQLQPGQRVRLSCAVLGINLQVFRVVKRDYRLGQPVMVTLHQDSASYYDEADAVAPLSSPSSSQSDPFVVDPPTGATVASGDAVTTFATDGTVLSRTRLTVPASTDALVTTNGALDIEYRLATETAWTRHASASGTATQVALEGLLDNRAYALRIRWRNGIGAYSAWVPLAVQTQGTLTRPVGWGDLQGRPADSAILNSYQVIGQNLLAESDQAAAVRFVVGYNPNGATLEGGAVRYTSSIPGWTTNDYVLSGGRLRNVFARQLGRHIGTADTAADSLGNTVALDFVFDGSVPVIPGQPLFGSVFVTAHRCKALVYLMLSDAAGNNIAFPVGAESVAPAALANVLGNYERLSVSATVPANVAFARLVLRKFNTFVGQPDSYLFWAAPQLEVAAAQAAGPSPYMPGPASAVGQLGYLGDLDATRGAPTGTLVGSTPAQTVEANAANALSNAAAAQSAANTANAAIADSASDGKLSPVEKQRDVIIYQSLLNDQAGLNAEADRYGITTEKATLATVLTALASNVGPLLANLTTTSDITGTAYRAYFADALNAKQALLNRVAEEAGKRAQWSGVSGTGKPQDNATVGAPAGTLVGSTPAQTVEANAANALSNAAAAQSAANTANAAIADSASDGKLSPVEKQRDVIIYQSLLNDQAGLNAEADRYGIVTEKATLATVLTALANNVGPLLANLTTTSDITGTAYRAYFADALNAKQALLNRVAEEAGKRAQWSGVSGTGRPSDNATRDVTFVNHGGTVTIEGNALTKASSGNTDGAWDSGVASRESYSGGAFVSFSPAQTGKYFMMGLNTASDTSDAGYLTLDYAIYIESTLVFVFESGAGYGPLDTYAAGDTFAVVYDGYRVRYLKNGAPMAREVKVNITAPLFLDSSFLHRGARAERIVFGPMSAMRGLEWGQMNDLVIDRASAIRSGKTSPTDSTPGYWIGFDAGVPKMIIGAGPGNRIVVDNTSGVTQEIPQQQLQTTGAVQNLGLLAGQVTSGGATATATVRLYTNGTCDGGNNWYAPTTTGIGSSYWVRFRRLSGNTPTGSLLDTWLALSSNRELTLQASSEIKNATGVVDISTSSSGSPIVSTISWELHAESYSGFIP